MGRMLKEKTEVFEHKVLRMSSGKELYVGVIYKQAVDFDNRTVTQEPCAYHLYIYENGQYKYSGTLDKGIGKALSA